MIDNPLPASRQLLQALFYLLHPCRRPLSGGGALPQFPPLARGGLGWGCLKSLAYALSRNLSPTLITQYPLQLPDKKRLQAKLHELLAQERESEL